MAKNRYSISDLMVRNSAVDPKKDGDNEEGRLRTYLREGSLSKAFDWLYEMLRYRCHGDIGLPVFMLPHLSRGLLQVLLHWLMRNQPDDVTREDNRKSIIAFTLFWYVCTWNEDRASRKAFGMIESGALPRARAIQRFDRVSLRHGNRVGVALDHP